MRQQQVSDAEITALAMGLDEQADKIGDIGKRAVDAGTERDVTDRELMAMLQFQAALGFTVANLVTRRELERQNSVAKAELVQQRGQVNGSL